MDNKSTPAKSTVYREKVDEFVRRAGTRIAELSDELRSALAREQRAKGPLQARSTQDEQLAAHTMLIAREAAERELADAQRQADAILVEGEARAANIDAEANRVLRSVLSQVQQSVEDARQTEEQQVAVASRDAHARLAGLLEGTSRRSSGEPPVAETEEARPETLSPEDPTDGSPPAARAEERQSPKPLEHRSANREATNVAPDSDAEYFAELKRAVEDGRPLGPPEDVAPEIDDLAPGSVSGVSAGPPEPSHESAPVPPAHRPVTPDLAPGWVIPVGDVCPPTHPIKAELSSLIYHLPGMFAYDRTRPDRCYARPRDAEADGLRRAKR